MKPTYQQQLQQLKTLFTTLQYRNFTEEEKLQYSTLSQQLKLN